MTYHHRSASCSQSRPGGPDNPALLTSKSTGPRRAVTSPTNRSTDAGSDTSAGNAPAIPPAVRIIRTVSSTCDSVRAVTPTEAPASASATATARPIPLPPPVTRATCPLRSIKSATGHLQFQKIVDSVGKHTHSSGVVVYQALPRQSYTAVPSSESTTRPTLARPTTKFVVQSATNHHL